MSVKGLRWSFRYVDTDGHVRDLPFKPQCNEVNDVHVQGNEESSRTLVPAQLI